VNNGDKYKDEDFMNIVNEVFEEDEIDDIIEEIGGKSDEDRLSDNNDCISDCSEDFIDINEKIIDSSQISALNGNTKQCTVYFYYITGNDYACASCMIDLRDVHIELLSAIRKHVIDCHDAIDGKFYSNCRKSLFFIFPCNMCPICTQ